MIRGVLLRVLEVPNVIAAATRLPAKATPAICFQEMYSHRFPLSFYLLQKFEPKACDNACESTLRGDENQCHREGSQWRADLKEEESVD